MKIRYITVEREYGSGGRKICEEAAKLCGIPCYGQEILRTVAQEKNVPLETLEEYEETVSSSFLYSLFVMTQSQTGNPDLLSDEAKLFVAEKRVIRHLADNGPAIFVGHCAFQALKDREGVLRVFIHGSDEDKRRRIIQDYGISPEDVAAACKKFNKKRSNYFEFCTRTKWRDLQNYDLVLDSSTLGLDACARTLAALYQK